MDLASMLVVSDDSGIVSVGLTQVIVWLVWTAGYSLLVIIGVMFCVVYLAYAERKIVSGMQQRKEPTLARYFGLLQPTADAIKLFSKETIIPSQAHRVIFLFAPIALFALSLAAWSVIPLNKDWVIANINVGILFLLAISSLSICGIVLAGWASNSRYAFLGSMRAAAQMISYKISMALVIICVLLVTGSLNLQEIVLAPRPLWVQLMLLPMLGVFFVSVLAECNRAPFNSPKSEPELSGGFMVEYSAVMYALLVFVKYSNMVLMSAITTILFLGGWLPPFGIDFLGVIPNIVWFVLKIFLVLFCLIWTRVTLPSFRYDQIMRLGWKVFLPLTLAWVVLVAGTLIAFDALPNQIVGVM